MDIKAFNHYFIKTYFHKKKFKLLHYCHFNVKTSYTMLYICDVLTCSISLTRNPNEEMLELKVHMVPNFIMHSYDFLD